MERTRDQTGLLLKWMECLSDATRVRLLRALERGELGVVDLCDVLGLPQSTVSRHLKILLDLEWLSSRRQGTAHLYRLLLDELEPAARKLWLLTREQTEHWPTWRQDSMRLNRRLRERKEQGASFFASAAGQWDKLRAQLYGSDFVGAALAMLLDPRWTVADLGCGTGEMARLIATSVRQVIGVDSSAAMLKTARRRLAGMDNVELRQGDLAMIPIDGESCHAAMLVLTLSYVDDVPAVLAEATRILASGGRLVVVDLLPHDRDDFRRQMGQASLGLEPDTLQEQMVEAGCDTISKRLLAPENDATGPALFVMGGTRK